MKVKALAMGQYNGRAMERGDVFEISSDQHFSGRWMEKVAEEPKSEASERRLPQNEDDRESIEEQLKAEALGVTK